MVFGAVISGNYLIVAFLSHGSMLHLVFRGMAAGMKGCSGLDEARMAELRDGTLPMHT